MPPPDLWPARWAISVLGSVASLRALQPTGMEYRVDARVTAFAIVLALIVAVVLSVVPMRLMRELAGNASLRASSFNAPGGWGNVAQRVFVIGQIAAAVVLTVGAALMIRTVLRLTHVPLGFDAGQVVQGTPSFPHAWREPAIYGPVTRATLVIVGVAADNRATQPGLLVAEAGPEVYVPWEQATSPFPTFLARVRGAPDAALRPIA